MEINAVSRLLRAVPAGLPGKMRIARRVLRKSLRGGPTVVTDRFGFHYHMPDDREPIAFHLIADGIYEPEVLSFIMARLSPGGIFVDVGANIGVFTLPVARHVGNKGRVLAIEASPTVFSCLGRNCTVNAAQNVRALNVAACASNGEASFYAAPADHFGMGSLGKQFHANPIMVPGATLDRLVAEAQIDHVDVLKIDVEGFESHVLQGAQKLLSGNQSPLVVFEFCDWAEARVPNARVVGAQRLLTDQGFKIWRLADFVRDRKPLCEPLESGYEMLVAAK